MLLNLLALVALGQIQSLPIEAPPAMAGAVAPVAAPVMAEPTAVAAPAAGAPAPGRLMADPVEQFKRDALNNFWAMNYQKLGFDEWSYIGMYYGTRVLFALILMTTAWTASSWSSGAVGAALGRVHFDETLTIFLAKLVRWLILLLVTLMCLSKFGVETTGFAAVIGAAGLAIGLAFQGTLSNFSAGAMLLIFRPYKVGDEVNVAGYTGTVREIELFTTAIDTPDNRRIIVPNSSIYGTVIENITHHPLRRASVEVGTAYSADIDETRRALERALHSVASIAPMPAPAVVLTELGGSSVNWSVRGWARREQFGEAKQALIRAVKLELDHAGIDIPFPQMQIHYELPAAESHQRAA
jgi:small conductance mechanosensitive channel